MSFENELKEEANKAKPEAVVDVVNDGHRFNIYWAWEYKGQKLHHHESELISDVDRDPDLAGSIIEIGLKAMKRSENDLDRRDLASH